MAYTAGMRLVAVDELFAYSDTVASTSFELASSPETDEQPEEAEQEPAMFLWPHKNGAGQEGFPLDPLARQLAYFMRSLDLAP